MPNLTKNTEEADLYSIMSGNIYFSIPLFQRLYVWKPKLVDALIADFNTVDDQEDTGHFLGALITYKEVTAASRSSRIDLIDGQQRITTIFLFLCAVVRVLSLKKESELAGEYAKHYLFVDKILAHERTNSKLLPSLQDRGQLNKILNEIVKNPDLKRELGSKFKYTAMSAPTNSNEDGQLRNNYNKFQNYLKIKFKDLDKDQIEQFLNKILLNVTVVEILIEDVASGPIIYNSLNGGQNPMTIGDLVRNSVFARLSSKPDEMINLEETHWRPFIDGFVSGKLKFFDEYFFPYGLTIDQNLKKTDTFSSLRKEWEGIDDPVQIIELLKIHQPCFMDLKTGSNRQDLATDLHNNFKKLTSLGAPASTFPFIMQLMSSFHKFEINETNCIKILKAIENFLVRRAVVGIEPTGLHAVFKRLWSDLDGNYTADKVIEIIDNHKTVQCPSNEEFAFAIKKRKLANAGICNFLLEELNTHLGGDKPGIKLTIEHIMPKNLTSDWNKDFTTEEHGNLLHTLANLIPLSSPMNSELQDSVYALKSHHYSEDSTFKAARELAKEYIEWTPESLNKRSETLSAWALNRWPDK
ncbi:DUF262 domain-containing HNH endonuclease family protein [Amylibacter sp.]|nr:DUF262 domain-containing HNH endonuclease family protein [Amylibacter sp.]